LDKQILNDFKEIIPYIKAILVFGSQIKGYSGKDSDIDICIIPKDAEKVYNFILKLNKPRYDIVIYDYCPWYLRGEILENHRIVYADDMDEVDFFIYKQRKIWLDQKRRQYKLNISELKRKVRRLSK